MAFRDNRTRRIEVYGMVGMRILRVIRLDEIVSGFGEYAGRPIQQIFHVLEFGLEVAPVVAKANGVGVWQVLPRPVEAGQFAIARVADADAIANIVPCEPHRLFAGRAHLQRNEARLGRGRECLMRRDDDSQLHAPIARCAASIT